MKRLLTAVTLAALMTGFSVAAQANVLDGHSGGLKGVFAGKEVLLDPNTGAVQGPDAFFTVGTEMYGIFSFSSLSGWNYAGDDVINGFEGTSIYSGVEGGSYFAVLSGLTIDNFGDYDEDPTVTPPKEVFFASGEIAMYHTNLSSREIADIISQSTYNPSERDFIYNNGSSFSLNDIIEDATAIFKATIDQGASASYVSDGTAYYYSFNGFASVLAGFEEWDNNITGGSDINLRATIRPSSYNQGAFSVRDGSVIAVRTAPTPEPGTFILMSLGLLVTAGFARRQQKM